MIWIFLLPLIGLVYADIYLHNPRGSNNRLDEPSRDVSNNRRLFNSQNNNRGGYLQGNMYYYEGSILPVEWTNQHSCNNPNNNCEIILQYMCGLEVRDGAIRTTIKEHDKHCENSNCDTDIKYGMNENHLNYLKCRSRRRNRGLFVADQNVRGKDARFTRQNRKGRRYGYECPEERDYYPYWHPSPWKDIVVMTNNISRCEFYKRESENVKGRGECYFPDNVVKMYATWRSFRVPNNKKECEKFTFRPRGRQLMRGVWIQQSSHKLPPPKCVKSPWSRDNHLGNGIGGQHNIFNWTMPSLQNNCVLRIRYNISTEDFNSWSVDSSNNGQDGLDLSELNGFTSRSEARSKGYLYKNNPTVTISPGVKLNLAINTAQFGRTFQDRSCMFTVKSRQEEGIAQDVPIHNVNVRGKRGNIVQVYPSVEYDFVPNTLHTQTGDYLHFQWTGSDNNPRNNDGQGRQGTDRSNIVVIGPEISNDPNTGDQNTRVGDWGRHYPAVIANTSFLGFSKEDRKHLALLSNVQYGGDMSQLNDGGTYYDLGPRPVLYPGMYHYMSTRNNAFTNRCQKAKIVSSGSIINQHMVYRRKDSKGNGK